MSSLFRRKLDELEDMFIASQDDLLARFSATYEENKRLKDEVKRLTEAGDRLCDKEFVETMGDYEFDNEAYAIRIRNWHKAKEGKRRA